jgi:predicted regulator of Ras-like GTPase activity (Roadblock/LC7/MglB family)
VSQTLASTIERLLVASGATGAGLIDEHGWLVEAAGSHGGLHVEVLASHVVTLAQAARQSLGEAMGEGSDELMIVGARHRLFVRAVEGYVVYLVTQRHDVEAHARTALDEALQELGGALACRAFGPSSGV